MHDVMTVGQIDLAGTTDLLRGYGLRLVLLPGGSAIPGTYWGEPEAGLSGDRLYVRPDTPVHSLLHEAAHFACLPPERRNGLHRDAGGDVAEEDAVCYLQVLLGAEIRGAGWSRDRLFADMDAWGYSFRLGSARRWFEEDADEALAWLRTRNLAKLPEKVPDTETTKTTEKVPDTGTTTGDEGRWIGENHHEPGPGEKSCD